MVDIIPGILESDPKELEHKVMLVASHVPYIQIDIGDNTIIPCETVRDASILAPIVGKGKKQGAQFEAHLMVARPETYIGDVVSAGFSRIVAHVESHDPREFLAEARTHEIDVGLAIDVDSDFELIEPFLEEVDFVLIMTVEAGASGKVFEEEAVEKIKTIHRNLPDLPIEVDGGMTPETAKIVREAGATRIVSTSYIFKHEHDIASAIESLKKDEG